jgi:hypothetical protein
MERVEGGEPLALPGSKMREWLPLGPKPQSSGWADSTMIGPGGNPPRGMRRGTDG